MQKQHRAITTGTASFGLWLLLQQNADQACPNVRGINAALPESKPRSFGVPDLVHGTNQDRLLHRLLKLGIDASGCLRGCGGGVSQDCRRNLFESCVFVERKARLLLSLPRIACFLMLRVMQL